MVCVASQLHPYGSARRNTEALVWIDISREMHDEVAVKHTYSAGEIDHFERKWRLCGSITKGYKAE